MLVERIRGTGECDVVRLVDSLKLRQELGNKSAGLASLRSRPWEYVALQATPAQWKAEDSALVPYAMWRDLQASSLRREKVRRAINMRLGGPECGGGWKCALSF